MYYCSSASKFWSRQIAERRVIPSPLNTYLLGGHAVWAFDFNQLRSMSPFLQGAWPRPRWRGGRYALTCAPALVSYRKLQLIVVATPISCPVLFLWSTP